MRRFRNVEGGNMEIIRAPEKNRLVHSSFRLKEDVLHALENEAWKRGVTLSSLVSKTLEDYIASEMYFEQLGFILVSKDFLRSIFNRLDDKKQIEEIGKRLGQTMTEEYVSRFYPEINSTSLIIFLGLWFRRFQSFHHRISGEVQHITVNHDINLNFSLVLQAMLGGLIEPVALGIVKFGNVTERAISFSFETRT